MPINQILVPLVLATLFALSCGNKDVNHDVMAVDIDQTPVKWQSIDNCWVYAMVGWIESLVLRDTGEERNYSESYLMYRYFQDQLLFKVPKRIQTAGLWVRGQHIVTKYGLMLEGDFIPEERDEAKSSRQKDAVDMINQRLADNNFRQRLQSTEDEERSKFVLSFLNEAFKLESVPDSSLIISTDDIEIQSTSGNRQSLTQELRRWRLVYHNPSLFAWQDGGLTVEQLPSLPAGGLSAAQISLERQVITALNKGDPVILEWFIDFNARNNEGVFSLAQLKAKGSGRNGYHQTVIEDYGARVFDQSGNLVDTIGEGEVSPTRRKRAETNGRLDFLIVKNSWGPSQSSYSVGGEAGYHKLEIDYLHSWIKSSLGSAVAPADTGLRGFILPR